MSKRFCEGQDNVEESEMLSKRHMGGCNVLRIERLRKHFKNEIKFANSYFFLSDMRI